MPINYKQYPPNWKQIRARILERSGNRCEQCGVPNHALVIRGILFGISVYQDMDGMVFDADDGRKLGGRYLGGLDKITKDGARIVLTIAHLDHDKENHNVSDDRLRALCQRCHLKYDMHNHVAKRKANRNKNQLSLFNP